MSCLLPTLSSNTALRNRENNPSWFDFCSLLPASSLRRDCVLPFVDIFLECDGGTGGRGGESGENRECGGRKSIGGIEIAERCSRNLDARSQVLVAGSSWLISRAAALMVKSVAEEKEVKCTVACTFLYLSSSYTIRDYGAYSTKV